jgi:ATP-dependent Clp protease adaptor protein ClpS
MKLFILNDNVNSFEHVINCVQRYLNYPYMQGLSIAHIVHDTGKCLVKESDDEMMIKEIYESLVKEGLNLRIEN